MATAYSLRIMQKVFYEPGPQHESFRDLNFREMLIAVPMVLGLLWLGLYPQPIMNKARPSITEQLQAYTAPEPTIAEPKTASIQPTDPTITTDQLAINQRAFTNLQIFQSPNLNHHEPD